MLIGRACAPKAPSMTKQSHLKSCFKLSETLRNQEELKPQYKLDTHYMITLSGSEGWVNTLFYAPLLKSWI